jgi:phospholipase/carboxylesterase
MLTGPAHIPANATHALVCLHGFGDEGASYLPLGHMLAQTLPDITLAILCPNGPMPTPFDQGYQWFADNGWTFRDRPGIRAAKEALWAYIKETIPTIPPQNIAVLGFSQGAMVAYYAVPRWPAPIGGVIAVAGMSLWHTELKADTCHKPPFLILHGREDDVVPADRALEAETGLNTLGFPTESHILPDLAHGIDAPALAHASAFLQSLWLEKEPS